MSAVTIQSIFEELAKEVNFQADKALLDRLTRFERQYVNRNEEHINFFGSNLAGVYKIKFNPSDRDTWFMDIINIDELHIADQLKHVSYIKDDWKRARDPFNHSCLWLIHQFYHSPHLTAQQKQQGMETTARVLLYRFISSILDHYFQFPASKETMEATIASLSRKFSIKTAGSWGVLLTQRAHEICSPNSIYHRVIANFNSDKDIVNAINDIQGRLREIIKNIWAVFAKMHKEGIKAETDSPFAEYDGEMILKEKSKRYSGYLRYIHEVVQDKTSFIRPEMLKVTLDLMHTTPERNLVEALTWMSTHYRMPKYEFLEQLVEQTLLHCFSLMEANRSLYAKPGQLDALLGKLKALYMASRMSDPQLLAMKEMADVLVQMSVSSRNVSLQSSVRTSVQLYIVLRALAMHYYQK